MRQSKCVFRLNHPLILTQHLASTLQPDVSNMTVLEYFTRQLDHPSMVSQIIQVSLCMCAPLIGFR